MSTGNSSEDDSEITESEVDDYVTKILANLKKGKMNVLRSENTYRCPFCGGKKKQDYAYKELLQHATGLGRSNCRKVIMKAKHKALTEYLSTDLVRTASPSLQLVVVEKVATKPQQEDLFVWPWMGILVNVPTKCNDFMLKDYLSKFNPLIVQSLWNLEGHRGTAIVDFSRDWSGFKNALAFENFFNSAHYGREDWTRTMHHGSNMYGWVARAEDYNSDGSIGYHLKLHGILKTITDLQNDVSQQRLVVVSNLSYLIADQDKHLQEFKSKYSETTISLNRTAEERNKLVRDYNEELQKMQNDVRIHTQKVLYENAKLNSELVYKRNELQVAYKQLNNLVAETDLEKNGLEEEKQKNAARNTALELATKEQTKADEDVLNLIEEQKREKEAALMKILQLEKQLDAKQQLELEIQQLRGKLQVMRHMGADDESMNKKVEHMKEELEEKEGDMEDLEALNHALVVKERESNDELQEARKEFVNYLTNKLTAKAAITIKRMGELDEKVFLNACKRRFPELSKNEVKEKAATVCTEWEEKLRNPEWYPFKVIMVDGKETEILKEDDPNLLNLKNDLGEEVCEAVSTALQEMNQYNPSGRYAVPELWNTTESRKATLKEVIQYILKRCPKSRRRV